MLLNEFTHYQVLLESHFYKYVCDIFGTEVELIYSLCYWGRKILKLFIKEKKHNLLENITEFACVREAVLNSMKSKDFIMGHVKRIRYLSPMRAAKVQMSLRIRAILPEPVLLAHTSSESRGTFRQKARSLAPLNGWACAIKICHDWMLEDTNSLDGAHYYYFFQLLGLDGSLVFLVSLSLNLRLKRYVLFYQYKMFILFYHMGRAKRICVFEHSVMTHFNCACPAIQKGQGSGFLSEGSSWLTACMSEQRRFWRDCADAQARLNLRCSHRL